MDKKTSDGPKAGPNIQLKPIRELQGMSFFIPEYQRGYRWKTRQVLDLLDDIDEFMKNNSGGMYCLQPLVVKKRPAKDKQDLLAEIKTKLSAEKEAEKKIQDIKDLLTEQWDVVDGQQRLTTLFILIKYLDNKPYYQIEYATRGGSSKFLQEINKDAALNNIDYMHIFNTYTQIDNWFDGKRDKKVSFRDTIINRTEFIWYECDEDPIEVFTRLNIGKISLTNSELVKALFLNSSNFASDKIRQNEIAVLWDRMEYALQKDEFWCFIHEDGYDQPTRIDFILELLVKLKNLKENNDKEKNDKGIDWYVKPKDLGDDHYKTFRYFYNLFKINKDKQDLFKNVWDEVKNIFDIFVEWYNDNECYHYIGFLVHNEERKKKIFDSVWKLLLEWERSVDKGDFKRKLKDKITEIIKINKRHLLDKQYEVNDNESKTNCYPLLLLFNIQTIVEKNNRFKEDGKFDALDFERFPFNLFKKEKGWDIEHIAPNTPHEFETNQERKEWLELVKSWKPELKKDIERCIKDLENDLDTDFDLLLDKLEEGTLDKNERNKVWNFCLLDQSTNRSYGNSIFALKRKEILLRERGLDVDGNPLNHTANDKAKKRRVFIPACTLNAFTKFYSPEAKDLSVWGEEDADKYKEAIFQTLQSFGVEK